MQFLYQKLKQLLKTCSLLFVIIITPLISYGQSVWVYETEERAIIGIEALIPSLEEELTSPLGALYIYSHIPLSDRINLQLDLPISQFDSETSLGNPYLGIEYILQESNILLDFGVRLPVADENNLGLVAGLLSDFSNLQAFLPSTTTLSLNIDYRYLGRSGLILRLGGGPNFLLPEGADEELILKYYGQILYNTGKFTFGGGLFGQYFATSGENLSFSDKTFHYFGLLGSYDFGDVSVGTYLRIPLNDDLNNDLNYVLGLNLAVSL